MAKVINVVYKVDDKALLKAKTEIQGIEKETKDSQKEMLKLDKNIQQVGNNGSNSFINFKNVLGGLSFAFLISQVTQLGKKIFDLGVQQEQLNIAFTTFLGSAQKAKQVIGDLTKFSIITPFTPDQVNNAAKTLLAFGVQSEELIPTLKMLGDVSAGTGKDLSEMAVIFGQIRSTGRLMGQDLLQLINAGFNPLQIISEKTGKSVAKLKKEMEEGKISFQDVAGAFQTATSEGGLFFDLMDKQSKSIGGVVSTITGNIEEGFKNIFQSQSGPLKEFVDRLQTLSEAFLQFTKSDQQLVDEAELELINDATKAYDLQVKVFGDSARARERIIELIAEQKKQLGEEEKRQLKIVNDLNNERDIRSIVASEEAVMLGEKQRLYDTKVIPALDAYIAKSGTAAKVTKEEAKEHKASKKEIDERRKALEAISKQLGMLSAVQRVKAKEEEIEKLEKIEREANDRSNENADRQRQYEQEKLRQAQEEEYRILEEASARKRAIQEAAFEFGVDLIGSLLLANTDSYAQDSEALQEKYDRELRLAGDNEVAKENIRRKQDADEKQLREKQLEDEKRQNVRRILIETVLNAVKALGLPPIPGANFIAAGKATAYGLLGAALARKFKDGEVNIDGPGTSTSDSIPAMISKGESVINADATKNSRNLLEAINNRTIDDRILNGAAASGGSRATEIDYKRLGEEFRKGKVDYDTHGYTIMKGIQKGQNFKQYMRSKQQGYK